MKDKLSSPTRDDVARLADVSSATVSRVYNNPDSVSAEKAELVRRAAEELGYKPNRQASRLRRKGTGIITLAAFVKKERPYYWGNQPLLKWMYADIIRSILDEVSHSMFQLQIETIENLEDLSRLTNTDGLIGYDIDRREEADALASLKKPYVICHHVEDFTVHPSVGTDNRGGGELQALWLKEQGVKKPLYITGKTEEVSADRRRMEGFLETFDKRNVRLIDNLSGLEEGKRRAGEIAEITESGGIDGIACVNDMTLLGILAGLEESKTGTIGAALRELPMIGYDNLPVLPLFPGTPATIDLRLNRIYRRAVSKLLKHLSGSAPLSGPLESHEIILPEIRTVKTSDPTPRQ